jgi:hypothetical protein
MTRPGPDFHIEVAVDHDDQVVAVKPPVETDFREEMFDVLDEAGLAKEVAVRGTFFATKHLPNGETYSELRISSTALSVASQKIMSIAKRSAEVLQGQDKTAEVSPYLLSAGGSQKLFGRRQNS